MLAPHEPPKLLEIFDTDKFVCSGSFKFYGKYHLWDCCMDSDYLIFQADECRQIPRTYEERCLHNRFIFKEHHKRDLDALPQAAEAGEWGSRGPTTPIGRCL